jgi:hypothetical protein
MMQAILPLLAPPFKAGELRFYLTLGVERVSNLIFIASIKL